MKEGYIIRDQSKAHFITATVVDWVDACLPAWQVFTRKVYKDVVIECLEFCIKNIGMILYGYVIMSNHVHMIVQSELGELSDLLRDFKKYTANKILELIQTEPESRREWMLERFKLATESHNRNKNYQFWRYGNHAEEIYSDKFMWSKLDYIHMNPVRTGIVEKASHYIYSSAGFYVNSTGLLKVQVMPNPVVDVLKRESILRYDKY